MIKEAIGTGNTVDEAKAAAMVELGISDFDDFTVEVVQTPTKKILGLFGGNPAKVKVSVSLPDPKPEKKESKKDNKKTEKKPEKKAEVKKQEVKEPVKEETVELPMEETNLYPETAEYIKSIVMSLGMQECTITEKSNAEEIYFELDCGDDYGIIIGKRGETLDAIQYLARMVANKGKSSYKRVAINVGNYRAKREETLRILARKTALRAVRQGRNISLEPMNPYERRIIHTAVQEIEGATSHSIGSDLDRRVVISPVEGAKHSGGNRGRNNRNGGRREKKEAYKPEISPDRAPKSDIDGSALYGKVEIRSTITD
ncbi:MAG: Jag N-terminal domain-containing protein [Clostridia bacterium]|nr:Jag N-terminal domain-containing protein [Clostridia bacterium]